MWVRPSGRTCGLKPAPTCFLAGYAYMEYLFAVGLVSILGQVVLLRELSVAFYGVELIYTLALGVWLLFSACGAMISRRMETPSFARINFLFLLLSLVIPLDVAFIRSIRQLFSDVPGAYLPLLTQIAVMSAALLPAGLLLGLLFQWTAKAYITGTRSLAAAYAIESVGGLAGGICATLFLKFGFQNFVIALLCALVAAGSTFLRTDGKRARWLRPASVIIIAALIALVWKAPSVDRLMTAWTHPNLVDTRDTPYSRITVTLRDEQVSVFENDALLFDTESTRVEEFVHLAALQHPNPERVLVVGGGIEGTIREVLQHSPRAVDYVELNRAIMDFVPRNLPLDTQKSFRAGNVRIIYDDPRQFLNRALSYDLILVGMPEPASGQTNRFYTQEFFRQCYARLNSDGIIAFSLASSENFWTAQLQHRMVSIYRAIRSIFPEVMFIPGSNNVVIGSRDRLTRDPLILANRLRTRGIRTNLISPSYLRYLYTNDRFQEIAGILQSGTDPANTDVRPICYQYTLMIWLSKFLPSMKFWDFSSLELRSRRTVLWILVCSLPALILSRASWRMRRVLLAGIAGFTGMVLETILILHFQTKNGILFQDIGILLTGFMAGLAAGAWAMARIKHHLSHGLGIALLLGFVLLSAGIGLEINSGRNMGLIETLAFLGLSGFWVAAIFAYASLREEGDQREAISPLYSADLAGGCIASVLTSLALAPIAGLVLTTHLMIPVVLLSILLL
jgi:spermidine synthase